MLSSCAVLGGFAIGARVSLLWQHSPNAKCQRVLVLTLCLIIIIIIIKNELIIVTLNTKNVADALYKVTECSGTHVGE